jgi:hypothetical protein
LNHDLVSKKVIEILLFDDLSTQRSSYNLLSPDEKYQLWTKHLTDELFKHESQFAKKQIIQESLNFITPSLFTNDLNPTIEKKLSEFHLKASKIFNHKELASIFMYFGNTSVEIANSSVESISKDCGCNANGQPNVCTDNFPGGMTYCKKGKDACKTSEKGCGWFWLNTCNGDCETVIFWIDDSY